MPDKEKKREGQKYKYLNISRTKKAFFIVFKGLSFGEKIKKLIKIADTSFSKRKDKISFLKRRYE